MNKQSLVCVGALLLGTALLPAQVDLTPVPQERKIVELKNLSGERLRRVSDVVSEFLKGVGAANFDPELGVVVLRGPASSIAAGEAILRRFDVPAVSQPGTTTSSQVQFRLYLVEASPEEGLAGVIPSEIAPAVAEMKKTFQFRTYRLLDTILMLSRGPASETRGSLPGTGTGFPTTYAVKVQSSGLYEKDRTFFLRGFEVFLRIPVTINTNTQFTDALIKTDLVVRPGQKLIVGKLSGEKPLNAIFVIVTVEAQ